MTAQLICLVLLVKENGDEWIVGVFPDLEEGRSIVAKLLPDVAFNWQKCANPGETDAYMWLAEPKEPLVFHSRRVNYFKICYIQMGYVSVSTHQFSELTGSASL